MRQQPNGPAARPTGGALQSLAEDLSEEVGVGPVLDRVLDHSTRLLDSAAGSISLVDERAGYYRKAADLGVACRSGQVFPLDEASPARWWPAAARWCSTATPPSPAGICRPATRCRGRGGRVPIWWRDAIIGADVVFAGAAAASPPRGRRWRRRAGRRRRHHQHPRQAERRRGPALDRRRRARRERRGLATVLLDCARPRRTWPGSGWRRQSGGAAERLGRAQTRSRRGWPAAPRAARPPARRRTGRWSRCCDGRAAGPAGGPDPGAGLGRRGRAGAAGPLQPGGRADRQGGADQRRRPCHPDAVPPGLVYGRTGLTLLASTTAAASSWPPPGRRRPHGGCGAWPRRPEGSRGPSSRVRPRLGPVIRDHVPYGERPATPAASPARSPPDPREREVLGLLARPHRPAGRRRPRDLARTVEKHCRRVLHKLGARNRTEAVARALEGGWAGC